jgi:integrase
MPRPNRGASLKWIEKRRCFYVVWFENGRERLRSTGTADSRAAEATLAEFIRERQRRDRSGQPRDPGEVSIAEVLDLYGVEHAPNTADPARIGCAISALLPFWGEKMASDVTKQACRDYATARGKKDATLRRELGTLRAALNFAVTEKVLTQAPFVLLPEKPEGKDRWLTRPEAARLLNAARTGRSDVRLYLPLFVALGLYTGARKEALLSLRWPQIDFERRRINFTKKADDEGQVAGRRRTNKRRAHIPIPARLLTFLRLAHKRRMSDIGFVIHDKGSPIKDIGGAWDGNPEQKTVQGSFGRACKRAGLPEVSPQHRGVAGALGRAHDAALRPPPPRLSGRGGCRARP